MTSDAKCMTSADRPVVLAAAAHPDDIEFMMAGTLLLLKEAGAEIHMWNLANGHCGTVRQSRDDIIRIRAAEAEASARLGGARSHPPLFDDLAVFYDQPSLARVGAVMRQIRPGIILTHSPRDYMEDHQNVCRLIVTAAFARGMRNFATQPPLPPWDGPVAVYHAMPHGLADEMGQRIQPDAYVNTSSVIALKREMLACHRSQKEWLDVSQGLDAYLNEMEGISAEVGRMSGRFTHAEGWRLHSRLGFAPEQFNPMRHLLKGDYNGATPE